MWAEQNRNAYNATVIKRMAVEGLSVTAQITMAEMVQEYAARVVKSMGTAGVDAKNVVVISRFFQSAQLKHPSEFLKAMELVGEKAVDATVRAYDNRGNRGQVKGYRPGDRDTGKLRKALNSSNMYRAAPDGLLFGNKSWMDSQARQWYRLNFGSGAVGAQGKRPRPHPMKFFGQTVGALSLAQYGPNLNPAHNYIPPGFFGDEGNPSKPSTPKGEQFTPLTRSDIFIRGPIAWNTTSRGIRAVGFLDGGVKSIAKNMPIAYTETLRRILQRGIENPETSVAGVAGISMTAQQRVLSKSNALMNKYAAGAKTSAFAGSARAL